MQPASSTAFLELRRAIKRDRLIHQALLEGRAADLGIAPSGCQHCGVRHSGHPHLFCFSSKDVDKAFVQAAGRGDLRIVQALLARRTLAEIHRISQAKAKKDKKWTDRLTHVNVRARPRFHRTPTALHRACAHGHDNVVSALLNIKASVGSRSARFATPLHVCATVDCAALLLRAGAHVNDLDYSQRDAVAAVQTGVYCTNPGERVRLARLLHQWRNQHEAPTRMTPFHGERKTLAWPGLSAAEVERVLRDGALMALARSKASPRSDWGSEPARATTEEVQKQLNCKDENGTHHGVSEAQPCAFEASCSPDWEVKAENRSPDGGSLDEHDEECPICLASLYCICGDEGNSEFGSLVKLRCGHVFHEMCLVPALRQCCLCPCCRRDTRTVVSDPRRRTM